MIKYAVDATRFRLKPVTDDDHEWLVELHNDPAVLKNMTHSQPITLAHHLAWWKKVSHDHRQLRLVFEIDQERAGFAKFYDIDQGNRNCVLGGDIHRDFRGKGHARKMWTLMLRKCFDELNLHRVGLTVAEYNDVGRHIYESLGFKEEGRLTQSLWRNEAYHDQIVMHLLQQDWNLMSEQK